MTIEAATLNSLMPLASAITVMGGAYLTLRKIAKDSEKSKKQNAAEILQSAKEEDSLIKAKLEARIELVKSDLAYVKLSMAKDMAHQKESHAKEIENLGEKVESIKIELQNQHSSIIKLLTKLVKNEEE